MTRDEMIKELDSFIKDCRLPEKGDLVSHADISNLLKAMDLLASLKGWKTHICTKTNQKAPKIGWK